MLRIIVTTCFALQVTLASAVAKSGDPLAGWQQGVRVAPLLGDAPRHSINAYFITPTESPDGRWVLCYTSTEREGYHGEIWIVRRATGEVRVLARDVTVEDAHRGACQQWMCGGRVVVFHDVRQGQWMVVAVDVETLKERVLAKDRQLGWGPADKSVTALYGLHWNPGPHRDLELLDVETGEIRTVATAAAVTKAYPEWVAKEFGDRPISVFFPILSPDLTKAIFKMATPAGGDYRSSKASLRLGIVCCDLTDGKMLWMRPAWRHPAWSPDSKMVLEMQGQGPALLDAATGVQVSREVVGPCRGGHPSLSPDGRLFVTDRAAADDAKTQEIVVGVMGEGRTVTIARFDDAHGAASWRRPNPHPTFSPDGKRIYFNASSDRWTRLMVAEAAAGQ